MNWREEVVDKLRQYSVMAHAAESIPAELHSLDQEACALQSAQSGRTGVRSIRSCEDRLMNILVKKQELELLLDRTESWLRVINMALGRLDQWDRRILQLLYIEDISVVKTCDELGLEKSTLYRYRDAALKRLTLSMYGVMES